MATLLKKLRDFTKPKEPQKHPKPNLATMPVEILNKIFVELDHESSICLGLASKRLHTVRREHHAPKGSDYMTITLHHLIKAWVGSAYYFCWSLHTYFHRTEFDDEDGCAGCGFHTSKGQVLGRSPDGDVCCVLSITSLNELQRLGTPTPDTYAFLERCAEEDKKPTANRFLRQYRMNRQQLITDLLATFHISAEGREKWIAAREKEQLRKVN